MCQAFSWVLRTFLHVCVFNVTLEKDKEEEERGRWRRKSGEERVEEGEEAGEEEGERREISSIWCDFPVMKHFCSKWSFRRKSKPRFVFNNCFSGEKNPALESR